MTSLRPATMADADLLLSWVNMPESLAASLKSNQPIARADHLAWLESVLADDGALIRIAEIENNPVGQVRLQQGEDGFEISIFVLNEARKKGVALDMVGYAIRELRNSCPGCRIIARVRHSNAPSRRLFECAGFFVEQILKDHFVYVYPA